MAAISDATTRVGRAEVPRGSPETCDEYVFPMSFAQQRLWFLDGIAPRNPFYNIPLRLPLHGRIDAGALERAISAVIRRHEALRTTFEVVDGEPSQIVRSSFPIELVRHHLGGVPAAQRAEAADALALAEARTPFDLRVGPLVRAVLVGLAPDRHELLLTIHHIVADGWSVGILAREISECYSAESTGRPARLPELPVQYADFAVWQRQHLSGERLDRLLWYWRTQLDDLPVLAMPTDRPRPRVLDYTGAHVPVSLPEQLANDVRALARQEQATPFMVLLAAFAAVLGRYAAQEDVIVGSPIANRNRRDTEQLIGFFVNSLILRCDLAGDPTFRELVGRVRSTCLDAYAHQDLPFERLVEELRPDRDLSRNPLFQVTFQLVNTPTTDGNGASSAPLIQRGSAIFDLAFTLVDASGALRGMIEYSTQLFDGATVQRFAAHYASSIRTAVADPDIRLADISFLTRAERRLLIEQRKPPPADVPTLTDAVATTIRSAPEAIAVVAEDDSLDFAGLDHRASLIAGRLSALVSPGDRVALLVDGSAWAPAAQLGIVRAGAAYVPLDPMQPTDRLAFILGDAEPVAVVVDGCSVGRLPPCELPIVRLDEIDPADRADPVDPVDPAQRASPAYVLYTSGTSGTPKGVIVPRSALENHMAWMCSEFAFGSEDRILQRTTPIFDASVWEFWAPMMSGARLVMLGTAAKRDPAAIAAAVRRHRVTVLQVVPSLLRVLLDEPDFLIADSLRVVFSGGEPLTAELCDRFAATLDAPLVNLYGPTEATIDATFHRCRPDHDHGVPIGRPIAGTSVVVVDRAGRPTPIGVPGRLHIGGDGLALGYLGGPRLTAERFVPDEFGASPGARRYDTGDIARFRTDGALEYLGRADRQVKIRGFRIEPEEVERAVEASAGVAAAAVVADGEQLVAFVVPDVSALSAGAEAEAADLEVLDRWEDVYSKIYAGLTDRNDADERDTVGWVSSFTGRRIGADAMEAWRDQTVERILANRPRRVLEIGCGTGMILTAVAPHVESYVGTDLSAHALQYVRDRLDPALTGTVNLLHRPAHVLDDLAAAEPFDMLVLNSVVQYFPSRRYLRQVLDDALGCLGRGGSLFVGDVRSLPLLAAFCATVEISRADGSDSAADLRRRIDDAVADEEELVIAPELFVDLAARNPGARCELLLKRTGHVTEMSTYRYDAIVTLLDDHRATPPSSTRLDWRRRCPDAEALAAHVASSDAHAVVVAGIPDLELRGPLAALAACAGDGRATAANLRALLDRSTSEGVPDAEALSGVARATDRQLVLRPSLGEPGFLDAVFVRPGFQPPPVEHTEVDVPLTNEPERGALAARLIPRLRDEVAQRLPEYMAPARYVMSTELPSLANGKVDRRRLVVPTEVRRLRVTPYVAPANPLEQTLANVWQDITGVEAVGVEDDFFRDLAGHSLLAARLVARLRAALDADVPLQLVFEAPTIAAMAAALASDTREDAGSEPSVRFEDREVERATG
jgi:amino acid adenylation domain-containing protein